MMKLWIFLGGHRKPDFFGDLFLNIIRLFLKVKTIQNWNIFGGLQTFQ